MLVVQPQQVAVYSSMGGACLAAWAPAGTRLHLLIALCLAAAAPTASRVFLALLLGAASPATSCPRTTVQCFTFPTSVSLAFTWYTAVAER